MNKVQIKVLPHGKNLPLPQYASPGSSGVDLYAAVENEFELKPGSTEMIPTGIAIAIPAGFEGQVRPRSGLAAKHSIGMLNSPGTIDSDYRGEIMVPLTNFSNSSYFINDGDRIAQLILARYEKLEWVPTETIPESKRGSGGFGHSGR